MKRVGTFLFKSFHLTSNIWHWKLTFFNLVNNWSMYFYFLYIFSRILDLTYARCINSNYTYIYIYIYTHHNLGIFSYWTTGLEISLLCVRIHQWYFYNKLYIQLAGEGEPGNWSNWLSQISTTSLNEMWYAEAPTELIKCLATNLRWWVRFLYIS